MSGALNQTNDNHYINNTGHQCEEKEIVSVKSFVKAGYYLVNKI